MQEAGIDPSLHFKTQGWRERTKPCKLFDVEYYLAQCKETNLQGLDPVTHYREQGWLKGFNPHRLFDVRYYLSEGAATLSPESEPLGHYILGGWRQGSRPHPLFDTQYYQAQLPLSARDTEPLAHYLTTGWKCGLQPMYLFDPTYYLSNRPDVRAAGVEPLQHYLDTGWSEASARPHPLFDPRWYMDTYLQRDSRGAEPLTHYVLIGAKAGYDPTPLFSAGWTPEWLEATGLFDARWYAKRYDVEQEHALAHFLDPQHSGNDPNPIFRKAEYVALNADLKGASIELLTHFVLYGAAEHRPWFASADGAAKVDLDDNVWRSGLTQAAPVFGESGTLPSRAPSATGVT